MGSPETYSTPRPADVHPPVADSTEIDSATLAKIDAAIEEIEAPEASE